MKKLILLVLSLAMVISLCACGGSGETPNNNGTTTLVEENTGTQNQTMDELLSSAIRLDNDSFLKECSSNIAKASNDYEGKPCIVEGFISECIRRSPAAAGAVVNGSSAVTAAAV